MSAQPIAFNDLAVGQTFTSVGRTLTETHLVMFSMLTGDQHPIHSDEVYAKSTRIGRRMFHGSFGIALALGMVGELFTLKEPVIGALGISDWSFKTPLFIGDTVHVELIVEGKRLASDGKRGIITRKLRLIKSDGTVAQEGAAAMMCVLTDNK